MIQRNYQRLTVYLYNVKGEKNFHTTYTYKDIPSQLEAIQVIWAMHATPTDTVHDMKRKVKKALYNGKEIELFNEEFNLTKNGWVLK